MLTPQQIESIAAQRGDKVVSAPSPESQSVAADLKSAWKIPDAPTESFNVLGGTVSTDLKGPIGGAIATLRDKVSGQADKLASDWQAAGENIKNNITKFDTHRDLTQYSPETKSSIETGLRDGTIRFEPSDTGGEYIHAAANGKFNEGDSFGSMAKDVLQRLSAAGHIAGTVGAAAWALPNRLLGAFVPDAIKNDYKKTIDFIATKATEDPTWMKAMTTINNLWNGLTPDLKESLGKDLPAAISLLGASKSSTLNPELTVDGLKNAVSSSIPTPPGGTPPASTPPVDINTVKLTPEQVKATIDQASQDLQAGYPKLAESLKQLDTTNITDRASLGETIMEKMGTGAFHSEPGFDSSGNIIDQALTKVVAPPAPAGGAAGVGAGAVDTAAIPKASEGFIPKMVQKVNKLFGQEMPPQVESALKDVSGGTFDTYRKIGEDATASYKNQTPMEYAGTRAQEALDTIQRKLDNIGSTKSSIIEQAGVGDKPVGNIVTKFRQEVLKYATSKTPVAGDVKLLKDINTEAKKLGNNPSAAEVDKFIDYVQDRIYTGKRNLSVPVTDQTTGAIRKITGQLNEGLKSKLPPSYRDLNAKYAQMVETRNELNTKLGMEGEKGGALMKRVFSPSDANTKQLFSEVQKVTGIDLVNEATVARYIMETMGDSRQASMLQQLQLPHMSKAGLLQFALDIANKKYNTPQMILDRARELTNDSQLREAQINKPNQTAK